MKRYIPLLLLLPLAFASPASASVHSYTVRGVWLSSYDTWNNSPPGCGIEYARSYGYPAIHNCAGGTGTYANPVTFAAQDSGVFNLAPGTRIYIPYFAKYFILEDLCSSCYTALAQADIWVGGVPASQEADQSNPANMVNLWQRESVIVNPGGHLPVRTVPLRKVSPMTGR